MVEDLHERSRWEPVRHTPPAMARTFLIWQVPHPPFLIWQVPVPHKPQLHVDLEWNFPFAPLLPSSPRSRRERGSLLSPGVTTGGVTTGGARKLGFRSAGVALRMSHPHARRGKAGGASPTGEARRQSSEERGFTQVSHHLCKLSTATLG